MKLSTKRTKGRILDVDMNKERFDRSLTGRGGHAPGTKACLVYVSIGAGADALHQLVLVLGVAARNVGRQVVVLLLLVVLPQLVVVVQLRHAAAEEYGRRAHMGHAADAPRRRRHTAI